MREELAREELRVLGSLVEKQMTTPDQYPLTLNALTLACNQKSNRDPVVGYDEQTVSDAVTSAKTKGLARFVHPSHGRSVLRYAHTMAEALGLSERQLALVAVLMLRGPQTPGELRSRTERMVGFDDLQDLERELSRLCGLDPPVVERLGRRPGQSQDRFAHLLGARSVVAEKVDDRYGGTTAASDDRTIRTSQAEPPPDPTGPSASVAPRDAGALLADFDGIREDLAELQVRLSELEAELAEIKSSLGMS